MDGVFYWFLPGTLGLLVDGKQRALIATVAPLLDELERRLPVPELAMEFVLVRVDMYA